MRPKILAVGGFAAGIVAAFGAAAIFSPKATVSPVAEILTLSEPPSSGWSWIAASGQLSGASIAEGKERIVRLPADDLPALKTWAEALVSPGEMTFISRGATGSALGQAGLVAVGWSQGRDMQTPRKVPDSALPKEIREIVRKLDKEVAR